MYLPKSHGRCKRVGITAYMVLDIIGFLQDLAQHLLVFKHLIWQVSRGRRHIE